MSKRGKQGLAALVVLVVGLVLLVTGIDDVTRDEARCDGEATASGDTCRTYGDGRSLERPSEARQAENGSGGDGRFSIVGGGTAVLLGLGYLGVLGRRQWKEAASARLRRESPLFQAVTSESVARTPTGSAPAPKPRLAEFATARGLRMRPADDPSLRAVVKSVHGVGIVAALLAQDRGSLNAARGRRPIVAEAAAGQLSGLPCTVLTYHKDGADLVACTVDLPDDVLPALFVEDRHHPLFPSPDTDGRRLIAGVAWFDTAYRTLCLDHDFGPTLLDAGLAEIVHRGRLRALTVHKGRLIGIIDAANASGSGLARAVDACVEMAVALSARLP